MLFLVAAILFMGLNAAGNDWVRVKLNNNASLKFPLMPESLDGDDEIMLACADTFGYFCAVVSAFPEAELRDTGKAGLLTMYRGLAERKMDFDNGRLVKMENFDYQGHPGLEFTYVVAGPDSGKLVKFVRTLLLDESIYSLEVWSDVRSTADIKPLKQQFFLSFEFNDGPDRFSPESILTMISNSFIALIIGFIGILIMVLLFVKHRGRKRVRA